MSACELNSGNSYISERTQSLNRIELPDTCLHGRCVSKDGKWQFFTYHGRLCRIQRHVYANGKYFCDVRFWRDGSSPIRKVMRMVLADDLKPAADPRESDEHSE